MDETWLQIIIVAVVLVVGIAGIVRMKSPSKGGDQLSAIVTEIQKVLEPQVKEMREVGKKSKIQVKKKKSDDKDKNLG